MTSFRPYVTTKRRYFLLVIHFNRCIFGLQQKQRRNRKKVTTNKQKAKQSFIVQNSAKNSFMPEMSH